ncbi:lipopolysaccharide heptosyltransferase family protein [Synechococcus sp. CS-1325]|uniref:glycosyltransferase family 9 protein n=1 Tax=unclassified Synechococcus TaxID=2626047 RepID=UPI000DB07B06|nr:MULTISPECIES: lipopolysaccharide heptosyltransferase family protein [unclassified Synechococcus]MCT0198802.1 lipopolysaccharide heptosyltransferase family protein [Synechococcus sp. CS-1325]MCT0212856.1 lipopolysaccharide heptosyltransferase family protein [Synechococcus sp. CS-1326]PZV00532.1 MAG: ADP-heptose--LPS heptosyltransferase [Cyanobium sp.]
MRVLFLIPGGSASQLQAIPAVAAVAAGLNAQVQVACPQESAAVWKLLPAVEKVLPFSFAAGVSLAEWANLLGAVREPDFQLSINLASGWALDLLLSLTHIPTRIARSGFSATTRLPAPPAGWPSQALEAWLRPLELPLDADAFRLSLRKADLDGAAAQLPPGKGPLLLLAPMPQTSVSPDWPAAHWQALPEAIRARLADLRVSRASGGSPVQQAAQVASADVVLSSDPSITELALLTGTPLVALGRSGDSLPRREGVQGVGTAGGLDQLGVAEVMQALGLG